jgi:hypothetical protein
MKEAMITFSIPCVLKLSLSNTIRQSKCQVWILRARIYSDAEDTPQNQQMFTRQLVYHLRRYLYVNPHGNVKKNVAIMDNTM